MKIKKDTNEGSNSAEIWDEGAYPARIVGFYGIGTQVVTFEGETKTPNQFVISVEIFDGDKSKIISSFPKTLSLNSKSNLTKIIKGILGGEVLLQEGDFDVATLVGAECQASIVKTTSKDGKSYNNISGFMRLMKGIKVPESETKLSIFGVNDDGSFEGDISDIPSFIADRVRGSKEVLEASVAGSPEGEQATAEDLPF